MKYEVKSFWECNKVLVTQIIIGALGMVHRILEQLLERIGIKKDFTMLHKACNNNDNNNNSNDRNNNNINNNTSLICRNSLLFSVLFKANFWRIFAGANYKGV